MCPDAGIIFHKHAGDAVKVGDSIMDVYGKDNSCLSAAAGILRSAVRYAATPPRKPPLIFKEITSADV